MTKILDILFYVTAALIAVVEGIALWTQSRKRKKLDMEINELMTIIKEKGKENEERKETLYTGDAGTDFDNSVNLLHDLSKR